MYSLAIDQKIGVLNALAEGCSIRSTERMTRHHRDTIMRLLVDAGTKTKNVMDALIKDVPLKNIQIDELWTFVGKKEKRLTIKEKANGKLGSKYIFVTIDRETKLIPCFRVGNRDLNNATLFMWSLRDKVKGQPYLTTDGFSPYLQAVQWTFGFGANFAQLVKVYASNGNPRREGYSPVDFVLTKRTVVSGQPDNQTSTSHIERQNLTMRMSLRRLTRLANGFSKKLENLEAALWLHVAYYNFARIHGSLRITPAMAAGITDHIWSIQEILNFSH